MIISNWYLWLPKYSWWNQLKSLKSSWLYIYIKHNILISWIQLVKIPFIYFEDSECFTSIDSGAWTSGSLRADGVMATTRHHCASHTLGPSWECKTKIHGMFHRYPVILTSNSWKMDGKQNNGWKIDGNGWKNEWKWPGRIGNLGKLTCQPPLLSAGSTFLGNGRFRTPKMVAMETLSYCISQDWARGALPSLRTNRTEPRFVWVKKCNCFKASFISGKKLSSFLLKIKRGKTPF